MENEVEFLCTPNHKPIKTNSMGYDLLMSIIGCQLVLPSFQDLQICQPCVVRKG
jgi:hypothetical protein